MWGLELLVKAEFMFLHIRLKMRGIGTFNTLAVYIEHFYFRNLEKT